jgi:hypothetical protein
MTRNIVLNKQSFLAYSLQITAELPLNLAGLSIGIGFEIGGIIF